jgi:ParE-like toxin of type II ParDE toxin-antitoxin system
VEGKGDRKGRRGYFGRPNLNDRAGAGCDSETAGAAWRKAEESARLGGRAALRETCSKSKHSSHATARPPPMMSSAKSSVKALLLEANPFLGKHRTPSGHRELVLTRFPFTIIYRIRRGAVTVSRVLHQRRQFP